MIIKKIEFQNIRSYSTASIDFPMGKPLFEGDIGSGKSSILMAIEFAFFGLGSETGGSLLKIGEKEGSVSLTFDVDGKEYEIKRGLTKKGSRVQQTEGSIRTPEGVLDLSPSELKEKVLEILMFNEAPDPKAQSRIYRYAVYTPQEEMKTILVMAPEDRLQILRRAFGIEDYRTAVNNSEGLAREIKMRIRELKAAAGSAADLRARKDAERDDLAGLRRKMSQLEGSEKEASARLAELKEEQGRLRDEELALATLTEETAAKERTAKRLEDELTELEGEMNRLKERSDKARPTVEAHALEPGTKSRPELERELRALEEKSKHLAILKDRVDQKIGEYQTIMKDGVCPVCDRPAEAHEFVERERAKESEAEHIAAEIEACEGSLEATRVQLKARTECDLAKEKVEVQKEALAETGRQLAKTEEKAGKLSEELGQARDSLRGSRQRLASLRDSAERLKAIEGRMADAEKILQDVHDEASRTRTMAEEREKRLAEIEQRLEEAESASRRMERLGDYHVWLEDYFAPTVGAIEKQVMTSLNQEFDSNFKKWFAVLIGDPQKEVRVDESFTPMVSQDGYEQESEYLSGGERTSVALAYRLALNTLVQRVSTGMRSNILILDEPTDGFSKEQLGSVREILDDIGSPQMVIVSHEKELESFADQIFRVTKAHGESKVEGASP